MKSFLLNFSSAQLVSVLLNNYILMQFCSTLCFLYKESKVQRTSVSNQNPNAGQGQCLQQVQSSQSLQSGLSELSIKVSGAMDRATSALFTENTGRLSIESCCNNEVLVLFWRHLCLARACLVLTTSHISFTFCTYLQVKIKIPKMFRIKFEY